MFSRNNTNTSGTIGLIHSVNSLSSQDNADLVIASFLNTFKCLLDLTGFTQNIKMGRSELWTKCFTGKKRFLDISLAPIFIKCAPKLALCDLTKRADYSPFSGNTLIQMLAPPTDTTNMALVSDDGWKQRAKWAVFWIPIVFVLFLLTNCARLHWSPGYKLKI